jgi:nitrogen fixation protein NifQ
LVARFEHDGFPALQVRHGHDMKWKKFLDAPLCAREQIPIGKAPGCAVCSDQPACFRPETA